MVKYCEIFISSVSACMFTPEHCSVNSILKTQSWNSPQEKLGLNWLVFFLFFVQNDWVWPAGKRRCFEPAAKSCCHSFSEWVEEKQYHCSGTLATLCPTQSAPGRDNRSLQEGSWLIQEAWPHVHPVVSVCIYVYPGLCWEYCEYM